MARSRLAFNHALSNAEENLPGKGACPRSDKELFGGRGIRDAIGLEEQEQQKQDKERDPKPA